MSVAPEEAVMVGDSFRHDVEGARAIGMRGVLLRRGVETPDGAALPHLATPDDGPVIASLLELPALLLRTM